MGRREQRKRKADGEKTVSVLSYIERLVEGNTTDEFV
jgi:hypothetical protein